MLANNNLPSGTLALDEQFNYLFASGAIWKFSTSSNNFQNYFSNISSAFTSASALTTSGSNIVLYRLAFPTTYLTVFTDTGSTLIKILDVQLNGYSATPRLAYSPNLNKVLVYGKSSSGPLVSFYYINYTSTAYVQLDFPSSEAVVDGANMFVAIEEQWVYVRQLASSLQLTPGGNQ